jgi:hypothetical protein
MGMKPKYNFSNQCYNNIVNFFIDLIPVKHNMLQDLYRSTKIVVGLRMDYEKIDAYGKMACCSRRSTRMILNVCIMVGLDM